MQLFCCYTNISLLNIKKKCYFFPDSVNPSVSDSSLNVVFKWKRRATQGQNIYYIKIIIYWYSLQRNVYIVMVQVYLICYTLYNELNTTHDVIGHCL